MREGMASIEDDCIFIQYPTQGKGISHDNRRPTKVNQLLAKSNQMPDHATMDSTDRIEAVRRFNRFYTRRIGVLNEGLLDSHFTLTECRILWELAHLENDQGITATDLGRQLDLDAGYLSRLLRALKDRQLVKATRNKDDARQSMLQLTPAGRRAFSPLDRRSQQQVDALLSRLSDAQQAELLQAFQRVQGLLDEPGSKSARNSFVLRPHRPGDMGWLVSRHGALYAREYQWDMRFEALVARIAADFIDHFDARREACWIAERDGINIGCVCLVQARDEATHEPVEGVAQLRLLLVEPSARGLGLGERLVAQCHRFARDAGYRRVRLWTNSLLTAARHIYTKAGYQLIASEPHHSFGHDLIGETWELDLSSHS
jgi:DNA-binding MarR family transcriptional regulator/GNAT superfamily N-acetyltransferase